MEATLDNSSTSIQIGDFEQTERKDFTNIFNEEMEETQQVMISNIS
jgi:hypothetical protein